MNPLHPLWRNIQSRLSLKADGIPGPQTMKASARALNLDAQATWPHIQSILGVLPDGIPGRKTAQALLEYLSEGGAASSTITPKPTSPKAPFLSSAIERFPSPTEKNVPLIFGSAGSGLTTCPLPYAMKLSWDPKTKVSKITCHKLISPQVQAIFEQTLAHYGQDELTRLKLDLYGGCFNDREKRGGTTKSMHAYGIAIDLDPEGNPLKAGRNKARFAGAEYEAFWSFVEAAGAYSLGRCKNYDWMHFQFAQP